MPTYHEGNMWSVFDQVDHFILIHSHKIFAEACSKYQGLEAGMNGFIASTENNYGLKCTSKVGLFQTRYTDDEEDTTGISCRSIKELKELAEANPDKSYALTRPCTEYPDFMFKSILDRLPENVQVWRHG